MITVASECSITKAVHCHVYQVPKTDVAVVIHFMRYPTDDVCKAAPTPRAQKEGYPKATIYEF